MYKKEIFTVVPVMDENKIRLTALATAKLAAKQVLIELNLAQEEVTKQDAYRRYRRTIVDRWISQGKINPVLRGTKTFLPVIELEACAQISDIVINIPQNDAV